MQIVQANLDVGGGVTSFIPFHGESRRPVLSIIIAKLGGASGAFIVGRLCRSTSSFSLVRLVG